MVKRWLLFFLVVCFFPSFLVAGTQDQQYVAALDNSVNAALVYFPMDQNGMLSEPGNFHLGCRGTETDLESSGTIARAHGNQFLVIVCPGSHQVVVVERMSDRFQVTDVVPSKGFHPVSASAHEDRVCAVNAGGSQIGTVACWHLSLQGKLTAIPGSLQNLSKVGSKPAQIRFSPSGKYLVVSERIKHGLAVYGLREHGLTPGVSYPTTGGEPAGFFFRKMKGGNYRLILKHGDGTVSTHNLDERTGTVYPVTASQISNVATGLVYKGKSYIRTPEGTIEVFGKTTLLATREGLPLNAGGLSLIEPVR